MNLQEKLKHYKLSEKEYKKALELLNKEELSVIEWALFSSLWKIIAIDTISSFNFVFMACF